jgi:hypothetical protein
MEKISNRKIKSYSKQAILEIVRKICDSYKTGEYTLESCCEKAGVPYRTYKDWWKRYEANPDNRESKWYCLAEVAGLWEQAQKKNKKENESKLVKRAESLLEKIISGYEYEVNTTHFKRGLDVDGNATLTPVGYKIEKKFRQPSVRAIIFVLTKLKPEIYGDLVIVSDVQQENNYSNWTLEEIEAEISHIKNELKNI